MDEIRQANKEDAESIASLGRTTFTETFGSLFRDSGDLKAYLDATFSEKKIEKSITKANNVYWIALIDGQAVGYAKLKLKSTTEFIASKNVSQLQKIYVLKDFLSKKIGKRLQDLLIARAMESGSQELWLSVLNSNERAIAFYEKNSFRIIGSHNFNIGKETFDFTAMSKRL